MPKGSRSGGSENLPSIKGLELEYSPDRSITNINDSSTKIYNQEPSTKLDAKYDNCDTVQTIQEGGLRGRIFGRTQRTEFDCEPKEKDSLKPEGDRPNSLERDKPKPEADKPKLEDVPKPESDRPKEDALKEEDTTPKPKPEEVEPEPEVEPVDFSQRLDLASEENDSGESFGESDYKMASFGESRWETSGEGESELNFETA